jgi:hypothetical protein
VCECVCLCKCVCTFAHSACQAGSALVEAGGDTHRNHRNRYCKVILSGPKNNLQLSTQVCIFLLCEPSLRTPFNADAPPPILHPALVFFQISTTSSSLSPPLHLNGRFSKRGFILLSLRVEAQSLGVCWTQSVCPVDVCGVSTNCQPGEGKATDGTQGLLLHRLG